MTKGTKSRRKKPLSSITELKRELRKEERSSNEVDAFFDKHHGKYDKVSKKCEAVNCSRVAACTVFVRNDQDFFDNLEDEEGTPYRSCSIHAGRKTFNGEKVLKEIEEIVSDEEETTSDTAVEDPSAQNPRPTTQTDKIEEITATVRVTPMGSPELQAMLNSTNKHTQVLSAAPSTSSSEHICEIHGCFTKANYEATIENGQGHAIARVCLEHATDNIQGGQTTNLHLINADNLSAYSMSSIALSDDSSNNTVNRITRTALKASSPGQSNTQKKRRPRSTSNPIQKNQLTLRSEERRVGKECRSRWSPYH